MPEQPAEVISTFDERLRWSTNLFIISGGAWALIITMLFVVLMSGSIRL